MNSCLVDVSPAELAKTAVAWDTEKHLRFDVPFQDIKPVIYLGRYYCLLRSNCINCRLLW